MSQASDAAERAAFADLLGAVRARVDERLAAWLRPRVREARAVSAEVGAAAEAIERLALRGGKRIRAALVAASYDACGGVGGLGAVDAAMLAVELLQVYLLVHDDWMDEDEVRRGGPSVHVELRGRLGSAHLGDAAAILAGDLASGYAQTALLEAEQAPGRVLRAARAFARIQEEVVTGQLAEMCAGIGQDAPPVEQIHALKTASYTVTGPLALGVHLAGADDAKAAELARFGRPLGIAFQLRDDLLGVFGDPSTTGKPVWNDIRQGKRTALVAELLRARVGDGGASEALLARVLGNANASDEEIEAVVRMMESSGARARVEARLEQLLAEARAALEAAAVHDGPGRHALAGAIRALGDRVK